MGSKIKLLALGVASLFYANFATAQEACAIKHVIIECAAWKESCPAGFRKGPQIGQPWPNGNDGGRTTCSRFACDALPTIIECAAWKESCPAGLKKGAQVGQPWPNGNDGGKTTCSRFSCN